LLLGELAQLGTLLPAATSVMILSVAARSVGVSSGMPSNSDRSTGGPAIMCTVLRGMMCGLVLP
jgi:hypothetical protein